MLILLLSAGLIGQSPDAITVEPPSLAEAVGANARMLARIRSIEVVTEDWSSRDGGATWHKGGEIRWWKDGDRQHYVATTTSVADAGGNLLGLEIQTEQSWSPSEARMLHRQGPSRDLATQAPAREWPVTLSGASISPPRNFDGDQLPASYILLAPTFEGSIAEAVESEAAAPVTIAAVGEPGAELVEVRFRSKVSPPLNVLPNMPILPPMLGTMDHLVVLDPARGYAIQRYEALTQPTGPPRNVVEALEYEEVEPGLFIPTKLRVSAGPGRIVERRVTSLRVNGPIAPESLVVDFPAETWVESFPSGTITVWGESGPGQVFGSRRAAELDKMQRLGIRHLFALSGFAGLAVVLVAVSAFRRRAEGRRRGLEAVAEVRS